MILRGFFMIASFRKVLAEEILLADGALGTLLVTRGAEPSTAKSSLNLSAPQTVSEVHEDYADAGQVQGRIVELDSSKT